MIPRILIYTPVHDWVGNATNAHGVHKRNYASPRGKCYFINKRVINVRWDGTIVGCRFDFNNENEIGNIRNYTNTNTSHNKYRLCEKCSDNWAVKA